MCHIRSGDIEFSAGRACWLLKRHRECEPGLGGIRSSRQTLHEADDLPVLYRKLSEVLKLAPDDHTEQVFIQILGSCQSVVESLAERAIR